MKIQESLVDCLNGVEISNNFYFSLWQKLEKNTKDSIYVLWIIITMSNVFYWGIVTQSSFPSIYQHMYISFF